MENFCSVDKSDWRWPVILDRFVGTAYSIADIALYAYTQVAGEGGFDLEPFPATRRWLSRVESVGAQLHTHHKVT